MSNVRCLWTNKKNLQTRTHNGLVHILLISCETSTNVFVWLTPMILTVNMELNGRMYISD